MSSAPEIRIMIVEDREVVRLGLVAALKQAELLNVIAEAANGEEAVRLVRAKSPDIVLMDIFMPVLNGIAATQKIKKDFPRVKVIMLTGSEQDTDEVMAAFSAGADAYCKKNIKMDRLIQVIEMVYEGALWIDPDIAPSVINLFQGPAHRESTFSGEKASVSHHFTEREMEVLEKIARGMSNKEIAQSLRLSIHTVKTYVKSIIQKMAVDDRTQVAIKAIQGKLVPTTDDKLL